jgi:hypothetical protein
MAAQAVSERHIAANVAAYAIPVTAMPVVTM